MTGEPVLTLGDARDVADTETFVKRAGRLDTGGALRLTGHGDVLSLTVCAVPGAGLLGAGIVLGMRVVALADPAELDVVVAFEAVTDRLARMRRSGSTELVVPPVTLDAPWAAIAPPRTGWTPRGVLPVEVVTGAATVGIAEIAAGAPAGSGAAAVADLRRRVWSRPLPVGADPEAPEPGPTAGLAFGAYALGFVAEPVTWHVAGPWRRLSTPSGHVLTR